MKAGILKYADAEIKYSFVDDHSGNWMQFWYSITPDHPEPIKNQIETIKQAEKEIFTKLDINPDSAALRRFFSSDLISHHDEIVKFKANQGTDFYLSLTEQPPSTGVKLALIGMCLSNIAAKHDSLVKSHNVTMTFSSPAG